MLHRRSLIITITVAAIVGGAHITTTATQDLVPAEYRALYDELEQHLVDFRGRVAPLEPRRDAPPTAVGVELLVANSNRGPVLLRPQTLQATRLTLDRLAELGVDCVSLSLQFPVLTSGYPRSAEYREFYVRVADEVRRHDLVLVVEMGTIFKEPEFAGHGIDYRGMTLTRFRDGLAEQAEFVAEALRPDHLTILSEPDTQARNLGIQIGVRDFTDIVAHVAKRVHTPTIRVGAGAGTWNPMEYFEALAKIPELDDINLHIYPIQRGYAFDKLLEVAELARRHGKSLSIGEAWLYKISVRELGRIDPVAAFGRDVWSFWQPLDILFLESVVGLARHVGADFCSFFWMNHLYGYLTYDARTARLGSIELRRELQVATAPHIVRGDLSGTGLAFRQVVEASR